MKIEKMEEIEEPISLTESSREGYEVKKIREIIYKINEIIERLTNLETYTYPED